MPSRRCSPSSTRWPGPTPSSPPTPPRFPITAIASKCKRPERVGGMHFFNPVPLMRLVEIIPGLKTAPWVTDAMMAIGRRMTREPVLCTDSPAFLVNHVGRALRAGVAAHPDREHRHAPPRSTASSTGAPGFKMGPFALADMVGIDVQHGVMESVYALFYNEPAFAPFPLSAQRVAGGLLRPEDGRRLVPLQGRQEGRAARRRRAAGAAEVGVGAPERASPRPAGAADRPLQAGRRDGRDGEQAERRGADRRHARSARTSPPPSSS